MVAVFRSVGGLVIDTEWLSATLRAASFFNDIRLSELVSHREVPETPRQQVILPKTKMSDNMSTMDKVVNPASKPNKYFWLGAAVFRYSFQPGYRWN